MFCCEFFSNGFSISSRYTKEKPIKRRDLIIAYLFLRHNIFIRGLFVFITYTHTSNMLYIDAVMGQMHDLSDGVCKR